MAVVVVTKVEEIENRLSQMIPGVNCTYPEFKLVSEDLFVATLTEEIDKEIIAELVKIHKGIQCEHSN